MTHAEKLVSLKQTLDAAQKELDRLVPLKESAQVNLKITKDYWIGTINRASQSEQQRAYDNYIERQRLYNIADTAVTDQIAVRDSAKKAYDAEASISGDQLVDITKGEITAQSNLDIASAKIAANKNIILIVVVAVVVIALFIFLLKK